MPLSSINQQMLDILKSFPDYRKPNHIPSSSAVGTSMMTPGNVHFGHQRHTIYTGNAIRSADYDGMMPQSAVNVGNLLPYPRTHNFEQFPELNASTGKAVMHFYIVLTFSLPLKLASIILFSSQPLIMISCIYRSRLKKEWEK